MTLRERAYYLAQEIFNCLPGEKDFDLKVNALTVQFEEVLKVGGQDQEPNTKPWKD